MDMKTLIKNGKIVSSEGIYQADLLIEGEVIIQTGHHLLEEEVEVIDASELFVLPGGVDVHTHMDLDTGVARAVDDFYTGTVAAACGGTTTIVDHMAFGPKDCNLGHQTKVYEQLAADKAVVDYGFHEVIQHMDEETKENMAWLCQQGITSFKGYLTYDYKLDDSAIYQMMLQCKELGAIPAFHAENHDILTYLRNKYKQEGMVSPQYHALSRPDTVEAEAIARLLSIARMAGDAPVYIVHLSTKKGLDVIREARNRGQKNIYVETCPQYLVLDESCYEKEDALKYIMSPPLRNISDQEALWQGLSNGEIQVVATDHCPFHYSVEKQRGKNDFTACPNGAPGVEERLSILYGEGVAKNRMTLEQFVKVTAENPAKIYGLFPRKGTLLPGSDADLVLLDPKKNNLITIENRHSAVDYTPYEGFSLQGSIESVFLRGKMIVKHNHFIGNKGQGRFLCRKQSMKI